jgi:hypothetical protein
MGIKTVRTSEKKLSLSKETLRRLSHDQLQRVAGGYTRETAVCDSNDGACGGSGGGCNELGRKVAI